MKHREHILHFDPVLFAGLHQCPPAANQDRRHAVLFFELPHRKPDPFAVYINDDCVDGNIQGCGRVLCLIVLLHKACGNDTGGDRYRADA